MHHFLSRESGNKTTRTFSIGPLAIDSTNQKPKHLRRRNPGAGRRRTKHSRRITTRPFQMRPRELPPCVLVRIIHARHRFSNVFCPPVEILPLRTIRRRLLRGLFYRFEDLFSHLSFVIARIPSVVQAARRAPDV